MVNPFEKLKRLKRKLKNQESEKRIAEYKESLKNKKKQDNGTNGQDS